MVPGATCVVLSQAKIDVSEGNAKKMCSSCTSDEQIFGNPTFWFHGWLICSFPGSLRDSLYLLYANAANVNCFIKRVLDLTVETQEANLAAYSLQRVVSLNMSRLWITSGLDSLRKCSATTILPAADKVHGGET